MSADFYDYLFKDLDYASYLKTYPIHKYYDLEDQDIPEQLKKHEKDDFSSVDPENTTAFPVELDDVTRLHYLITSRKVTTVMELGVGKSSIAMADALKQNKTEHANFVSEHLRRSNAFELHSIDNMEEWIEKCQNSMPTALQPYILFHYCPLQIGSFQDRLCTYYQNMPNICPDFIYIDAPGQFFVEGDLRGLTTAHLDRMPMVADILTIEHFLQPGTLLVVDGRAANARFLKANLQRHWRYMYDEDFDQHFFELHEKPLGRINKRQLEYCLPPEFFESL